MSQGTFGWVATETHNFDGKLRPFFPFFGSKWRDANRYPAPRGAVAEPFAGSAGYSCYYNPRAVTLVDVDPILVGVWRYLIAVTPAEVRALPDVEPGASVDDLPGLCEEARWLIGFWLNRGSSTPKKRRTRFSSEEGDAQLVWGTRARERIASQVEKIRHWTVREGAYHTLDGDFATWFVDPPYVAMGRYYRMKLAPEEYPALATWCRARPGEVIVCEQRGATWLPFGPLGHLKSQRGVSEEVVWTQRRAA